MASRYLVVPRILISREAAEALSNLPEQDKPRALVRFLSAQTPDDLHRAFESIRVVPWTEPDERTGIEGLAAQHR